jgi:hypothetical protein
MLQAGRLENRRRWRSGRRFLSIEQFDLQRFGGVHHQRRHVTGSFSLEPGDTSHWRNDIANKTSDTALSPHGISATFTMTAAPALSIAQKVFVAWPSGMATNWVLESASPINATSWTPVTNKPVTVDGQPGVVLDGNATQQYFRFNYLP